VLDPPFSLLHSESFDIDVPGRRSKLKVSDAPDPRTFSLCYGQIS